MDSLYEILGVDRRASDREIRQAYKRQALLHHPDKGGSAEIFRTVQLAFETLSSSLRRKSYDDHFELYQQNTRPASSPQERSSFRSKRTSTFSGLRKHSPEFSVSEPLGAGVPVKKRDDRGRTPRAQLLRSLQRLYVVIESQPGDVRKEVIYHLTHPLKKELTNFIVHQRARGVGRSYLERAAVSKSRLWLCGAPGRAVSRERCGFQGA